MKAEIVAQAITNEIAKTIISKSVGLTPAECVEALEIVEDYCGDWANQIKSEQEP